MNSRKNATSINRQKITTTCNNKKQEYVTKFYSLLNIYNVLIEVLQKQFGLDCMKFTCEFLLKALNKMNTKTSHYNKTLSKIYKRKILH